ncbi:MAG TPA: DNA-directed RNA polymerase subunit beta', partial [Leptospiraceae bacterium]|nr:DNA-directed RNA polymerase subunit beta' [Leptospiraceae bacterium]
DLGFHYATIFAPSISISDIRVSPKKADLISGANKEVADVQKAHKNGVITNDERYKKIIEIWTRTNELITESMFAELEKDQRGFNPIYIMAQSGARGSKQQIRQLAGMRGLMARPSGEIIELAIRSNFREGLGVLEFFISTHGARKGLADTALKTADAGYLTRRLVDISQDVIITEVDCGTENGVRLRAVKEGDKTIVSMGDRVFGRVVAEDVCDPVTSVVMIPRGTLITKAHSAKINSMGIESVFIRSALTCDTRHGICTKCYGMDLARLKPVELGEAVGTIAAQSIGQPGTQLTMRTFHVGGVATNVQVKESTYKLPHEAFILGIGGKLVTNPQKQQVFVNRGNINACRVSQVMDASKLINMRVEKGQAVVPGEIIASGYAGEEKSVTAESQGTIDIRDGKFMILGEQMTIPVRAGAAIMVEAGQILDKNETMATFDPFNEVVISEHSGTVQLQDIVEGKNLKKDEEGNFRIAEYKRERLSPRIVVGGTDYTVPLNSLLLVKDGQKIEQGTILVKITSGVEKTRDITGGLPRVEELFEARRPKDASTLAEIDGRIEDFNEVVKEKKVLYIIPDSEEQEKIKVTIPVYKRVRVRHGDYVKGGDQLDEGTLDPHDILRIKGINALHEFLIYEVQEVYRLQGVYIN